MLKSSVRWSRQERTHSALVTYRLDIWKILKSSLRQSRKSDLFNLGHAPVAKILIITKPNRFSDFIILLRLTDDSLRYPCIHNIYNTLPLLYLIFMICILIYFVGLDVLILLTFLIFCLSEFLDNCKSPFDAISENNLSVYNNKVPSQYLPDRKSPSFRTHA